MSQWGRAKAIETSYGGYRFRSRLEARYAVYFDALGLDWLYECEGFQLGKSRYLPDFYLPKHDTFIEIKPVFPSEDEGVKAYRLHRATGKPVCIAVGLPPGETCTIAFASYVDDGARQVGLFDTVAWTYCRQCGHYDLVYGGSSQRIVNSVTGGPCRLCQCSVPDRADEATLVTAWVIAKRARFESF